jgi:zinc transporter ZupT
MAPSAPECEDWQGHSMRRFWLALGAFFLGLVGGWGAAIGYYVVGTSQHWFFDRDGGGAMATMFILGPALGVMAGLVCAVVVVLRTGKPRPST